MRPMHIYRNITEVKKANRAWAKRTGRAYWFGPDEMRFFNTVIERGIYAGNLFVTRDRPSDDHPWGWNVRKALPTGQIETVSDFMDPFRSLAAAKDWAERQPGGAKAGDRSKAAAQRKRDAKRGGKLEALARALKNGR